MKKVIASLILAVALSTAAAQPTTIGDMSCKEWAATPTRDKGAWVMGYLSGMNTLNDILQNNDVLKDAPDPNELLKDIFQRCLRSPELAVSNVVMSVYLGIRSKAAKPQK